MCYGWRSKIFSQYVLIKNSEYPNWRLKQLCKPKHKIVGYALFTFCCSIDCSTCAALCCCLWHEKIQAVMKTTIKSVLWQLL